MVIPWELSLLKTNCCHYADANFVVIDDFGVVMTTTSGDTSDDKGGIMTIIGFRYLTWLIFSADKLPVIATERFS